MLSAVHSQKLLLFLQFLARGPNFEESVLARRMSSVNYLLMLLVLRETEREREPNLLSFQTRSLHIRSLLEKRGRNQRQHIPSCSVAPCLHEAVMESPNQALLRHMPSSLLHPKTRPTRPSAPNQQFNAHTMNGHRHTMRPHEWEYHRSARFVMQTRHFDSCWMFVLEPEELYDPCTLMFFYKGHVAS